MQMKNRSIILLSVLLLIGCKTENKHENIIKDDNNVAINLNEYFESLKRLQKFNGVVLVEKEGKRLLFKEYNMTDDETSTLKVDKQSQFDIHSISKLMAQAAVCDLEKENLITRSSNVADYIADFPRGDEISIQFLIDNQSGLPRRFSQKIPNLIKATPEEVVELIKNEKLIFEPGEETGYSNLGYQVLYFIISKIVNKPFVQYINEIYFEPLKMSNSGAHFYLQRNNLYDLAKNHEYNDGKIEVAPNIENNGKNQAKIYSTVEDLSLFINHIKQPSYSNLIKNKADKIGWSGGGDGLFTHASYNFSGNYNLIFFSNYDEIPFGDILKTVDQIIKKKPYELPQIINRKAIEISPSILERYEGKYRVREFNNNVFEFKVENEHLVLYQDGEKGGVLNAESESTFFAETDDEDYFEFKKSNKGEYKLIIHYKKVELEGKKENGM